MTDWQGYIIAAVIGLLVGIERERRHPNQKIMGLRTFLLIAILGAFAGDSTSAWLSGLLTLFTLGLIIAGYFSQKANTTKSDLGLTTEFAGALVYCLGFMSHSSPVLVAIIGPIVALVLLSKSNLHRFTHSIKGNELRAALLLLLGATIVLNLVPDKTVDPWDIFNPRDFGKLVMILAALEFSSYMVMKIFSQKTGAIFIGVFGGLVSSTTVVLSTSKNAKAQPQTRMTQLITAMTAVLSSLVELIIILTLIAPVLFASIGWPVLAAVLAGSITVLMLSKKSQTPNSDLILKSPLDWKGVFRLAVMLAAILMLISATKIWVGESAGMIVSVLTGFFELHGVTIANATMVSKDKLEVQVASQSILMAVFASLIAKSTIAWMIERGFFAKAFSVFSILLGVSAGITFWFLN